MAVQLTRGGLEAARKGECSEPLLLQIRELKQNAASKWGFKALDGSGGSIDGVLASQVARAVADGSLKLRDGDVVRATEYACNLVGEGHKLIVTALEVAAPAAPGDAGAPRDQQPPATPACARVKAEPGAPPPPGAAGGQQQHATPPHAPRPGVGGPGPTPSPSEQARTPAPLPLSPVRRGAAAPTPGPAAPSPAPAGVGGGIAVRQARAGVQPIAALNPYDTQWTIKAKVMRKMPLRSFNARGGQQRVFGVELADAAGGQIAANFWREAVDKWADSLEEGKVYYFSKFQVKVANKQYNSVRNDYEISFDGRTEVEECADQGGINGAATVEIVPIDRLPGYIGRRAPVDVMGVVVSMGQAGTVKRKADNSELPRRDVTLGDASGRSVVLTLWNDNAHAALLDGAEGQVLQVTNIRVGDYNGCSASSGMRSSLTLNPDTKEGAALREWYAAQGGAAPFAPLGEGAGGGGGGPDGARRNKVDMLSSILVAGEAPPPEAKPTYATLHATVVFINPDQTMYYLADPDTGKKVVEQGGRFWCEGESKMVDAAEHRYLLSLKVADASGEGWLNLFNKEAATVMGASADHIAALRSSGDEEGFKAALKAARWQPWVLKVQARSREYNGERRMRYTVVQAGPLDYAAEAARLLGQIAAM